MFLKELIEDLEYTIIQGDINTKVINICNDSRNIKNNDLFFCISGAVSDGHEYINDVCQKGASVLIVEKEILNVPSRVTVIKVNNSRYAMGIISSKFFKEPSKKLKVIGITGTKGKTTTTYMIQSMLESAGIKTGLIGTIEIYDGKEKKNASTTTPTIFLIYI